MTGFDHEQLDVYHVAIEFVAVANDLAGGLPQGRGYLADQLLRASTSIVLNIAEGAGEFSKNDKARFYRFARRSATECAAIFDVCRVLGFDATNQILVGREMLLKIVSMLVRLIRSIQQTGKGTGRGKGTDKGTEMPF